MKGRSPYNKPSIRESDLYGLLLKMGGEARWTDLKDKARVELHWGPTTLKQTLDQMIKGKSIIKTAKLGTKGAEVWYRTKTPFDLLKPIIVWKPTLQFEPHEDFITKFVANIREKAQKLEGKEKEDFLRGHLHGAVFGFTMASHWTYLLESLRTAEVQKLEKSEALQVSGLSYDFSVRRVDEILLELLLEYREYSMEIIDQMLREPYRPPSVPPRSMKGFLGSVASALKWIDSYGKKGDEEKRALPKKS